MQLVLVPARGNESGGVRFGLPGVLVVRGQVGQIGAREFEQADVLAGAGERRSAVIGRPHVAAQNEAEGPEPVVAWDTTLLGSSPWAFA